MMITLFKILDVIHNRVGGDNNNPDLISAEKLVNDIVKMIGREKYSK